MSEPDAPAHTTDELAAELQQMARWLGLGHVQVAVDARGDLPVALAAILNR